MRAQPRRVAGMVDPVMAGSADREQSLRLPLRIFEGCMHLVPAVGQFHDPAHSNLLHGLYTELTVQLIGCKRAQSTAALIQLGRITR